MASKVLSFATRTSRQPGWTNAELAELYRVEHSLAQAGITVETDRGVTDEGDPWFVFCRDCGDVVVHVARFGGYYRLYSPALLKPLVGPSFAALTKAFVSGLRSPVQADANVSIHPAALLSVLIAAIIYSVDFHANAAKAAEASAGHEIVNPHSAHLLGGQDLSSELPARDTLFHNLVASIKALLDPSEASSSQQFSFLSIIEIAATAAVMVGLSSLIEVSQYLKSEFFAAALADDHKCLVADCQKDLVLPDQTKEKASSHIAGDTSDSPIITISGLDNLQSDGDGKFNLTFVTQQNNIVLTSVVAINGTGSTSSLDSGPIPGTDHRAATLDSAQRDGGTIAAINGGTYIVAANHAETALPPQSSDYSGVAVLNGSGNQEFVWPADNVNAVSLFLTQGDGSIDLSATGGANKITLNGNGNLQINDIVTGDLPQFVVSAGYTQTVSLSFAAATPAIFTIQLNGSDNLSFAHFSTSAASVQLTLDSEGSVANVVTISDQAVVTSNLNITVIGVQDLTLNESAAVFNKTTLDTSGLSGNLTVGLNLDNVFQSVDLSQVNASNFIVGNSGNIALLHAASGSHIQLSSDLNIVDLTVAGVTDTAPGSLGVDLNSNTTNAITVNLLDVFFASTFALNSSGAGPGSANTVETLTVSSLSALTITGNSALVVDSINGLSAGDSQNVTIDAHALTASLNLDISDIADTAALGRSITLIGGSGNNVLTNNTVSESTTFVTGAGSNVVNIGGGAIRDSIVGLSSVDAVNIGAGTHSDILVNEMAGGISQTTVNAQANLVAAAELASNLAGSNAAQQALLFSYQGSLYVFIDATGNHIFDASHDAIIKLVGVNVAAADLSGVFHSA